MQIFDTFADAQAAHPKLIPIAQNGPSPADRYEADWSGMRLRGAGLQGGRDAGWMLAFSREKPGPLDSGVGFLIAYEIVDSSKTGRLAVLRAGWPNETNESERARITGDSTIWNFKERDNVGEADIEVIDAAIKP